MWCVEKEAIMAVDGIPVIEAVLIIVNSLMAVLMNLFLFFLVYKERRLRTVFNYFILNLSFADILVSLNMLASMVSNLINPALVQEITACTISGFINILCFVASVMALAAVSINRYYLVVQWQQYHQKFSRKRTKIFISLVWIFSIILVIPPLIGWGRYGYHDSKSICFAVWSASISYMVFMVGMCFMGPISATVLSVVCIVKHKRQLRRAIVHHKDSGVSTISNLNGQNVPIPRSFTTEKKTKDEFRITLSVIVIVGLFMLSWGPFVVVMFLNTVSNQRVPRWIEFGSMALGCFNSTGNPIVYLIMNRNFKNAAKRKLCKNKVNNMMLAQSYVGQTKPDNSNFTDC